MPWPRETQLLPYARSADCNYSQSILRIKLCSPRMQSVYNEQFVTFLRVISTSMQGNDYPTDRLPPGGVTILSPCSYWCLAPHASHIPSPHLDASRCSWIISHTGESLFPLQLHLDLCCISSNSNTSEHVHPVFALYVLPLLQRGEVKTLRERHWRAFFFYSFHFPPTEK